MGVASTKVVGRESMEHLATLLLSSRQSRSDVSLCTAHACIQKQRLKKLEIPLSLKGNCREEVACALLIGVK